MDLALCLEVFRALGDSRTVNVLEHKLIDILGEMELDVVSDILYSYARDRTGSKIVVTYLLKCVEKLTSTTKDLPASTAA